MFTSERWHTRREHLLRALLPRCPLARVSRVRLSSASLASLAHLPSIRRHHALPSSIFHPLLQWLRHTVPTIPAYSIHHSMYNNIVPHDPQLLFFGHSFYRSRRMGVPAAFETLNRRWANRNPVASKKTFQAVLHSATMEEKV